MQVKCTFERMRFTDSFVSVEIIPAYGYRKGASRVQLRSPAVRPVAWANAPSRWYKDGFCLWFDAYNEIDARDAFIDAQEAYFAGDVKPEGLPSDWTFEQFDSMSIQDALTGFDLFTSKDIYEPFNASILIVCHKRQVVWDKVRGGFGATGKGTYECTVPTIEDVIEPFRIARDAYFAGEIALGGINPINRI